MNVDFAFVCDYAEATGKLNALGIGFETIIGKQLPVRHPHFCLVIQLRTSTVEAGEKNIKVFLIDADGKEVIKPLEGKFNIPKTPGGLESVGRFVMEFANVQFPLYDTYSVRAVIDGTEMVNIGFKVTPPPKQQQPPPPLPPNQQAS
ncbi:MAG: hypothetical protein HN929_12065 [Chloroflexi bacterium]|nr:hypothetical protein [Chloroflexota bacterium]MBT7288984.1 hypothetical protein [Chloroflexota bacterium]